MLFAIDTKEEGANPKIEKGAGSCQIVVLEQGRQTFVEEALRKDIFNFQE